MNNEEKKVEEKKDNIIKTNKEMDQDLIKNIENLEVYKDVKPKKKKKFWKIFLVILVCLCMGLSVYGVYYLSSHKTKEEKIDMETILFTEENLPRVDASLATQPLVDAVIKNFTGKTVKDFGIEYTNTHPGYVKLINNEADLIVVTEPSDEELKLAKDKGIELEVTKVVNEGFVFFVNIDNPVDNVTLEQIQKVYTGEITNWKDLGGKDAKIVAFQRPINSGSQTGLLSLVMKDKKVKVPTTTEQISSMYGIIDVVSDYDNGINAVGYSYYYYANTMYKNDNLKYLGINGVIPTYETIQDESYPLLSAYYIVTRKGETNDNVKKLKDAMLSKRGQLVAKEAGYIPCIK